MKNTILLLMLISVLLTSCKKDHNEIPAEVFSANGDISSKLNEFRNVLGTLNTTPNATGGRREINWDGIPDSLLNKALPNNFFNQTGNVSTSVQRGLVYDNGEFQVSSNGFAGLNQAAASEFKSFSGTKVFANVINADWPIGFEIAGQSVTASVRAFGMVFSDVDIAGSVTLEFFDGANSIGKYSVPAHDNNTSFSFLGVKFTDRSFNKVMVHHQKILADGEKDISQGGKHDLVVIDDLIYSEPVK